jgi:peptidase M28-like protein
MKTRVRGLLLGLGVLFLISFTCAAATDPADIAMSKIRPEAIHADIAFLADDLLQGRFPGTPGYQIAAKFMASQFQAFGLQPAGDNGTYFQAMPLRGSTVDAANTTLSWSVGGQSHTLAYPKDFIATPDPLRADTSVEAPVVFAGFGITAPELRHDDYQAIDAKGKIVAIIAGAPLQFESSLRAYYSSAETKRQMAVAHGAVGIITLDDPAYEHIYSYQHRVKTLDSPAIHWLDGNGHTNGYFPELKALGLLNLDRAREFLQDAGHSPDEVFAAAASGKLAPFNTPITANIHVATKSVDIQSSNIVAKLPGSDPALRDQYVLFTAHLDHLGIGAPINGDKIYHGALDNGSGSADLIEIARAMAGMYPHPRRSILFVSVTGEEEGLIGSDYFAHNPTVAKSSIVADVNVDEDLMLWPLQDVVVYGVEHSTLKSVVNEAADRLDLAVSPDPQPEQVIFIRSDQYSFVRQGIPSIFPVAGVKSDDPKIDAKKIEQNWEDNIYHSPLDNMDQPFDFEAGAKFARFALLCGYLVAQQPQRPVWNPHDFFGQHFAHSK